MIEFLLNNEVVRIEHERADLTVLEYLREERNLCGTKEGCASGDCGACTVVLVESNEKGLCYQNCNSCITFLGSIHGKQLIAVEHLKDKQMLHPVQQAMVDHHGSQCGFCTPGFVMSMFSLYKDQPGQLSVSERKSMTEAYLGGNLCRCTGYKPIVDAAISSTASPSDDHFTQHKTEIKRQLLKITQSKTSGMENYHIPKNCQALSDLIKRSPGARLLAGGTDLALEVTQQLNPIDQIIYLGNVSELREIVTTKQHYEIGAAVTLSELGNLIKGEYPDLSHLLLRFGSKQIRNLGTIGGNIANASPIGDLPPVLLSLGATLRLQSSTTDRIVDIDDFFINYRQTALAKNEFLRSIVFPRSDTNHQFKVYKISKRFDDDISAVCIAFYLQIEDTIVKSIRIACGGMAAIPKRALMCEDALVGQPLNLESIEEARQAIVEDFQPIDDVRASADYRIQVTQNLLTRLYLELTSPEVLTRVTHHV